jgi:hypothetical protein
VKCNDVFSFKTWIDLILVVNCGLAQINHQMFGGWPHRQFHHYSFASDAVNDKDCHEHFNDPNSISTRSTLQMDEWIVSTFTYIHPAS